MEESEALPRLLSDVWQLWSRFVHHFFLPCRPGLARTVFGHAIRVMTDLDARATILSVDGVGAYDHVLRSSMLGKLMEVPHLRLLIPFVGTRTPIPPVTSGKTSTWQHEGGEQGDPLIPLLFCLALMNSSLSRLTPLTLFPPKGMRDALLPPSKKFTFESVISAATSLPSHPPPPSVHSPRASSHVR